MIVILAKGNVGRVLTLPLCTSLQFGVTLLIIEMIGGSGCVTAEQMAMVLLVGW